MIPVERKTCDSKPPFGQIAALFVVTAYTAFLASCTTLPFLDLPNHATRAFLIGKLIGSHEYDQLFQFQPHFVPYILGDLLFSAVLAWTPFYAGAACWLAFAFLLFPVALFAYVRARLGTVFSPALILFTGCYLGSNWFFLSGYLNYCLSVAFGLFALSAWEYWIQNRAKRKASCYYPLFALLFTCTYLTHLAGFFFAGAIVALAGGVRWLKKEISFRELILSGLPPGTLALLHSAAGHLGSNATDLWVYRTALDKLLAVGAMFYRFDLTIDVLLGILFCGIIVTGLLCARSAHDNNERSRVQETLFTLIGLIVLYLLLPLDLGPTSDVDVRALPYLMVFALMLSCEIASRNACKLQKMNVAAAVLALLNLIFLALSLAPKEEFLAQYLHALREIPVGQRVLPVATLPDTGRIQIAQHPAEPYMTFAPGMAPYVFSENTSGDQFAYFRYVGSPYMPAIHWYQRNLEIDWQKIASEYNYIIITKPFDRSRLGLVELVQTYSNDAAAIFRIERPVSD